MMRLRPLPCLLIFIAAWTGWFVIVTWFRNANLFSSQFDLGIMDQVMWQTIHGHIFSMTSPTLGVLQSRLAIHGDPLLLVYTPFYALWQDPRTLTTLQTLAVASGALPLFWLAKRQLTTTWATIISGLYLLQPALQWSVLFDVHAVILATPLILWIVWAAVTKRRWLVYFFIALTLLAKEEVGLVMALTAAVLGWRKTISRRTAWVLGSISLGWVLLMTGVIIPTYAGNDVHFAIQYFSEYGQTVPTVIVGLLRHPIVLWHDLINLTSLGYLTILLGSAAFFPLRRPAWLLPAMPIIVMNLISNDPQMQSLYYQYTATITPFVLLATIDGVGSLTKASPRWLIAWLTIWVGLMLWLWAPLPGMRHHRDAMQVFVTNPYVKEVRQLTVAIPPDVALAVSNDLGPQFSRRNRLWTFPFALEQADGVIVLLNRPHDVLPQADLRASLVTLQNDPSWETIAEWNHELFYLRKKE